MNRYLKIYRESIRISFASASTYRANFLLNTLIMLVSNVLFPLVTVLIYRTGQSFPGWSLYGVLLIQSVFLLSMGVSNMLFGGLLWLTLRNIVDGTFDLMLIKPVDTLFYMIASTFEFDSVGLLIGGSILFGVAASHTASAGLIGWGLFLILFLAGILVMMGISLIMAATSFKWIGNSRIPEIFDSIKAFGKYPQNIFPKAVNSFASFIIPVAMIGFFPASALTGGTSPIMFYSIVPCIAFALFGLYLYKYMIHLYEGAGG